MPLDPQEEHQQRSAIAAKLCLSDDSDWDTILRVHQCGLYGLGDQTSWHQLWRTLWSRYLGLPDGCSVVQIREALSMLRHYGDPCSDLVHFGTLWGLGLTPEVGVPCLEKAVKSYKKAYEAWRREILGR